MDVGLAIGRPRSALHAGNFTETANAALHASDRSSPWHDDGQLVSNPSGLEPAVHPQPLTPPRPIPAQARQRSFSNFSRPIVRPPQPSTPPDGSLHRPPQTQRPRAPSLQFHSSFFYRSPTSPLVNQSTFDADDRTSRLTHDLSKENRRRTLPTEFFQNMRHLPSSLAQAARQPSSFQHEATFPFQGRDARRSATFTSPFLGSVSPPMPNFLRSRRSSFSSEASPLQPSSMVGSYEESILRGRMSSMPSKPVDFTAQIGALGKGDCKPKYPPHVSLTFPAVFYNWSPVDMPTTTEPSPYVGQIDIEHGLPPPKKRRKKIQGPEAAEKDGSGHTEVMAKHVAEDRPQKRRQRSPSPSGLLLGGSYRIPQHGQLQILIKNPNKTAVKLFLIPYDLDGMEAGTKTFIRQNCYTAGPIIEHPLSSKGATEPSRASGEGLVGPDKPRLRYSVHLHICCPGRGRFYLYKEIKVVFANRVPDNKEKLRSEIRLPEPRYSPWRPLTESGSSLSTAEARRSLETQRRRRSYQAGPGAESGVSVAMRRGSSLGSRVDPPTPPVPTMPPLETLLVGSAQTTSATARESTSAEAQLSETEPGSRGSGLHSPLSPQLSRISSNLGGSVRSSSSNDSAGSGYSKLSKGDVGYGGLFARPGTPEAGESLLSRKLRRLEEDRSRQA